MSEDREDSKAATPAEVIAQARRWTPGILHHLGEEARRDFEALCNLALDYAESQERHDEALELVRRCPEAEPREVAVNRAAEATGILTGRAVKS